MQECLGFKGKVTIREDQQRVLVDFGKNGRNVLYIAGTGTGKLLVYQVLIASLR